MPPSHVSNVPRCHIRERLECLNRRDRLLDAAYIKKVMGPLCMLSPRLAMGIVEDLAASSRYILDPAAYILKRCSDVLFVSVCDGPDRQYMERGCTAKSAPSRLLSPKDVESNDDNEEEEYSNHSDEEEPEHDTPSAQSKRPVKKLFPTRQMVWVSNLPRHVSRDDITRILQDCWQIKRMQYLSKNHDDTSGAFVAFSHPKSVVMAVKCSSATIGDKSIFIDYWRRNKSNQFSKRREISRSRSPLQRPSEGFGQMCHHSVSVDESLANEAA